MNGPTSFGLTDQGFQAKSQSEIISELQATLQATFGATINVTPQSVFGQLIGIFAEREAAIWQVAEAVYAAFTPDGARGHILDQLASLTGATRLPPTKSTVVGIATGTPGTIIPAGKVVSQTYQGAQVRFVVASNTQIPASGTTVSLVVEADRTGAMVAPANAAWTIETPIAGWQGFATTVPASVGRDVESDAAFRTRREGLLRSAGSAAIGAVRSRVLQVPGVRSVSVFENTSDEVDAGGLAPHSFEVVVFVDDEAWVINPSDIPNSPRTITSNAIAQAIWDTKPAGIQSSSVGIAGVTTITGTAIDHSDPPLSHAIQFSVPEDVPVVLALEVAIDPKVFPANGLDQIKSAIRLYSELRLTPGVSVYRSAIIAQVFTVPGVLDVPHVQYQTLVNGVLTWRELDTSISIAARQHASLSVTTVTT